MFLGHPLPFLLKKKKKKKRFSYVQVTPGLILNNITLLDNFYWINISKKSHL